MTIFGSRIQIAIIGRLLAKRVDVRIDQRPMMAIWIRDRKPWHESQASRRVNAEEIIDFGHFGVVLPPHQDGLLWCVPLEYEWNLCRCKHSVQTMCELGTASGLGGSKLRR